MSNTEMNYLHFENPPIDYRPVVFWSWNERMEPDEIRLQLNLMKDAGLGGGFIHSRIGLLTDYLKEDWFKAVAAVIDESKKLGFKVYLYDEDKWPSGFAGGLVPLADEAYRMKALVARPGSQTMPPTFTPIGSPHPAVSIYRWVSPLGDHWFNGTCYADLMSKKAMRKFLEQSYESYYDRFAADYGKEIVLEFTDEPCPIFRGRLPQGAVPYSDELPEAFRRKHGYDPLPHLHKLFLDEPGAERFRIHYFRTINHLFEANFSKQIGHWCQQHRIGLTGHYMYENDLYGQQLWGTKIMPNYRHQQQPGIDHLARQIDEIVSAKQCCSILNQFGQKRMLSELYGCSGQAVSFEDRLWIATQQIQLGVNFLNPHLSLYTMSGCRKRDFPPNLFYQQPWWPVNAELDIPLSRLCYAMSCGTYAADTLVIHPQESTFALWQTRYQVTAPPSELTVDVEPTTKPSKEKIDAIDNAFKQLLLNLQNAHIHYDLGDETLIAEQSSVLCVEGKAVFRIGKMSYSNVVLPSMHTLSLTTLERLKQFADSEGKICRCGSGPYVLDGCPSDELDAFTKTLPFYDTADLAGMLSRSAVVTVAAQKGPSGWIWSHVRHLQDGSALLLVSNLNRSGYFEGSVSLQGQYNGVHVLDHWSRRRQRVQFDYANGKTSVSLSLAPVQSRLLVFGAVDTTEGHVSLLEQSIQAEVQINPTCIQARRLDDNALVLDTALWAINGELLTAKPLPVIVLQEMLNEQHYCGPLTLQYEFEVNTLSVAQPLKLVLEHPEYYRILVNGSECRYEGLEHWLDIRFLPIDISAKVVQGRNTIRLECPAFAYGDKSSIDNAAARYGTEIEAIYVVGDFAVHAQYLPPQYDASYWKRWNLRPELVAVKDQTACLVDPIPLVLNKLTESGLPFYAGRAEYVFELPDFDQGAGRVYLALEKMNAACAEVLIDSSSAGFIVTHPYRLDVTDHYGPGKKARIILYSTLRNLLGPHHHPDGELINNHPMSFLPQPPSGETWKQLVDNWLHKNNTPADWRADYCIVTFGEVGGISIVSI